MKTPVPTHDAIAQRARQIWESEGNPTGRDHEIWLNAERQLSTARLTAETAAESVVEFSLPSSTSEGDAVKAALQTPESRGTAKPPGKTAPQLAAAAEVRGTGTSQSTTTPATNPTPTPPPPAHAPAHATPAPSPAATAAQAQQQKKAARSPLVAAPHAAHTPTPPQSGKPIWDKPHSK